MIIGPILRRLRLKIYSNSAFSPAVCGFVSLVAVKFDGQICFVVLVKFTKRRKRVKFGLQIGF